MQVAVIRREGHAATEPAHMSATANWTGARWDLLHHHRGKKGRRFILASDAAGFMVLS
jgi:hypothetical protein